MRTRTVVVVAAAVAVALPMGPADAGRERDTTIELPSGFAGEGVAIGRGKTFYAGSLADGRIARGNLRDRMAQVFVSNPIVAPAVGLKADVRHGLLWVAGGPSKQAAVYDLDNAAPVAELTLTTAPEDAFINDVTVTRDAAYFTNSFRPELYRVPVTRAGVVGTPETLPLLGPAGDFLPGFNVNGIASSADGRTLIVVNTQRGLLYTVDAGTGESAVIDLGGERVVSGDGILLKGRTLYVLRNGAIPGTENEIVIIRLDGSLSSGRVVDRITSDLFETATTLAKRGRTLVAVNGQFVTPPPIDAESEIVVLRTR